MPLGPVPLHWLTLAIYRFCHFLSKQYGNTNSRDHLLCIACTLLFLRIWSGTMRHGTAIHCIVTLIWSLSTTKRSKKRWRTYWSRVGKTLCCSKVYISGCRPWCTFLIPTNSRVGYADHLPTRPVVDGVSVTWRKASLFVKLLQFTMKHWMIHRSRTVMAEYRDAMGVDRRTATGRRGTKTW